MGIGMGELGGMMVGDIRMGDITTVMDCRMGTVRSRIDEVRVYGEGNKCFDDAQFEPMDHARETGCLAPRLWLSHADLHEICLSSLLLASLATSHERPWQKGPRAHP